MVNVTVWGVHVDSSQFDYTNHSSNVGFLRSVNISLIALVGLFVGLRIFVRSCVVRRIFPDDVLILIASVFTIALASLCIAATHHGLGTHVWLLPIENVLDIIERCIQYLYVCQILYACAISFTRLAIIASYLRFIQDRKFRIAMYATSVIIIGLWFTGVFVTIFQCNPVSGAWDFDAGKSQCIDFIDYLYASSAISIVTDIILCALPWPYLWSLHLPAKQKVFLCLLLGGGAGACIAAILRVAGLHTLRNMDVTYQWVACLNLSVIECSLGIICVSIPPLRPLATRLFPKALPAAPTLPAELPPRRFSHGRGIWTEWSDAENQPEIEEHKDCDVYPADNTRAKYGGYGVPVDSATGSENGDNKLKS